MEQAPFELGRGPVEPGQPERGLFDKGRFEQGPFEQGPFEQGPFEQGPFDPARLEPAPRATSGVSTAPRGRAGRHARVTWPGDSDTSTAMPTVPLPTVPAPLPGIPAWPCPPALPGLAAAPGEGALSQAASGTRAVLSGVAADPRLPGWCRRAFASLVVGATVGVLLDWRLGLLTAALIVTADVLFSIRTSPVIPARARAASARRRTRRRLGRAAGSGYRALHARHLAAQGAVIDHLVVGPAGVFAVGSQRWDRRLPVRFTKRGQLFHGPFDQSGQLDRACWQAAQASRLISDALGQPVAVRPALAIYGPALPWTLISIGGVDVFCGRRLRRYLRHAGSARSGQLLGDRQAELIHAVAAQVLPPARQRAR